MTSTFTEAATAVAEEGAGAVALLIALPSDLEPLLRAATASNAHPDDVRLATGFASLVERIRTASADDQQRCVADCGWRLAGSRFSTVVASGHVPRPVAGLVIGVCSRCGTTREEVRTAARAALRRVAFPELRPIEVHPASGRA